MIESIDSLLSCAKKQGKRKIAVACAHDNHVLRSIYDLHKANVVDAILIGSENKIRQIAQDHKIDLSEYQILNVEDKNEACRLAVTLAKKGEAHAVMKGLVDTSIILKAVLDKDIGLRCAKHLSHVALFEIPGFERLLLVTDSAMNIAPDLEAKKDIIANSVLVANAIGIKKPVVACLCAVEKVNPKMPATVDAAELVRANNAGELEHCTVIGPVALDNAISVEAAKHKGITDPNAGYADILLVPNIETGNVLYKSLVYLARSKVASLIVGAKVPVIITSRADNVQSKVHSILFALALAPKGGELIDK